MNWPIPLALILAILPASLGAQAGTARYVAALAAEKGEGDLDQAVKLYQDLLEQHTAGQVNAALVARARDRLALLGFHAPEPRITPLPFQTLAERLGLTPTDRLAAGKQPVGGLQMMGVALRPRYFRKEGESAPGSISDPHIGSFIYLVEQQIRGLRYALGITGLLEYVEEVAQHRRKPRAPGPYELYQLGLFAECQEGDLASAALLYEQVLATPSAPEQLRRRLTRRLREWRESLERRDGQH